jgi:hypothetical protein
MSMRHPRPRRMVGATAFLAVVAVAALALVPTALEGGTQHGLQASVVGSTRGPLCVSSCGESTVWEFIYVSNGNQIVSATDGQFDGRDTLHNSFIVTSVDQRIFVDGDEYSDATFYPPPNESPRSWADHWPMTLKCTPFPDTSPCTGIGKPAVVPGEQAAVLFAGWGHASGEPNGKYVFRYTVHGTLNGKPVDVSGSSVPIKMTD